MNIDRIVKRFLDWLTEAVQMIPHPLLRFAVVTEGLLALIFLVAVLWGVPLQQLSWFSIPLIVLFLLTLAGVYARVRGKHIELQEVTEGKKELEKQEQSREEAKALLSRFWQIQDGEPLFCAISTVGSEDTGRYKRRATGFGEIRGYASVVYSLARAYEADATKDARLYFGDTFPDDRRRERSLILLGGDDLNQVAAEMFDQFERNEYELPFRFVYEKTEDGRDTGIKYLACGDGDAGEEYHPHLKEDRVVEDFGVVARLPNPLNPHYSKLFLFAGCHTYGTAAAAKVVAAKSILNRIEETCSYYRKSKFFVAVIHVNVISDVYFHIDRMEVFYPLDEETLKPIPEGIVRDVRFRGSP